ncbi:MAG: D-alanyl-D-alanine carboxypeptidase [Oscillospiraceae bacterium]|nr:D-alanyl-D-alanine carboxypeptidase [Oscillospiraceae bacterium]
MKKSLISIFACISIVLGSVAHAELDLTSQAAFVMDTQTGDSYYELNADELLAPASMTKIMTAYIVYRKIADNTITKDTIIIADAEDAISSRTGDATNALIEEGQAYTVDEILGAILVPSACAACDMIGKYLCGNTQEFVNLMNATVAELGLDAYFEDASGLSDSNRITARSMARLTSCLINEYPDVLTYTSRPYITFGGLTYANTNALIPGGANEYWGADGFKTGTTNLAGGCLTSTAQRYGVRIVAVTMHSDFGPARFDDSIRLLDQGFITADYLYNSLFSTDMRIFINDCEIPTFSYQGPEKGLCFLMEDLLNYGFDVDWDNETQTITARRKPANAITGIPMEIYHSYPVGSKIFDVARNSGISARIICSGKEYTFSNVYNLNGYTAVLADELAEFADSYIWNENEKCLDIRLMGKSFSVMNYENLIKGYYLAYMER